jgi:hypothetical protein
MDTVTAFARRPESVPSVAPATATLETHRTLAVTATYLLSEEGRKVSLLAGGDGRAVQELAVEVPINRLHLVSVDANGIARLKLRPRYELDGEQRVVRVDAAPSYDGPPDIDDLFRDAGRNHQLERAYEAGRRTVKEKRREADRERKTPIAQAFLADLTQRAAVHPAPTPKRCFVAAEHGRILFDASTDEGIAKEVPAEAHRRFRADLRGRRDRNLTERAAQLALHEEKKSVIANWIAQHGTPDQQARQAAGVLPMAEAIDAMTERAFAVLTDHARYVHDGIERLQGHVRQCPEHTDRVVTRDDLLVTSTNVERMTAAQFAVVQQTKALMPDATVVLRAHKLTWKRQTQIALPPIFGLLVTQRVGPFTLRREYAAPAA